MSDSAIFRGYNSPMANVATRLLSMLFLFQSRRRWTVRELAEELDVSPRTVHRYITMLEELGIPLYSERGPYGGFSLLRSYKLPPIIFTPEEASVLYMGARLVTDFWGKTFQDAATGVTRQARQRPAGRPAGGSPPRPAKPDRSGRHFPGLHSLSRPHGDPAGLHGQ